MQERKLCSEVVDVAMLCNSDVVCGVVQAVCCLFICSGVVCAGTVVPIM